MVKAVVACIVVVIGGTSAMAIVPFALGLWDTRTPAIELAILLMTVAGTLAIGRRLFGRPYLRRQVVVAAVAAPFALAMVLAAVLFALDLAGADCPRSGMDFISDCNDLATASMAVFLLGAYPVALLLLIAVGVLLAAGLKRTLAARRRDGSAPAAGGWR